jgi:hypothetical protein
VTCFHYVTLLSDLFWLFIIIFQSWLWVVWLHDHEILINNVFMVSYFFPPSLFPGDPLSPFSNSRTETWTKYSFESKCKNLKKKGPKMKKKTLEIKIIKKCSMHNEKKNETEYLFRFQVRTLKFLLFLNQ